MTPEQLKDLVTKAKAAGGGNKVINPLAKSPVLDEPTKNRIEELRKQNQTLKITVDVSDERGELMRELRKLLKNGMDSQQIENTMRSFRELIQDYTISKVTE